MLIPKEPVKVPYSNDLWETPLIAANYIEIWYGDHSTYQYKYIKGYRMFDNWLTIKHENYTKYINLDKVISVTIHDKESEE